MTHHFLRRRALGLTSALGVAALMLSACGSDADPEPEDTGAAAEEETGGEETPGDDLEPLTIGISQFVQHGALDASAAGFKQAFLDAGYVEGETVTFEEQNAQGDVANATTIAQTFAGADLDLVLAIATPSAQAAAQNITDIPVFFTAVTDAESAGLVDSNESPGGNVTGTSDMNPVAEQIELVTEIVPEAATIGIVYDSGEVNSGVQVDIAKEAAGALGIEIVESTVTNSSEVQQATEALGDVDAIYVPTDNTVVSAIPALIQVAESKGIPVIGAESGTVEGGAIATLGIDYERLGYQTGEMALRMLEGEDISAMAVETLAELETVINPDAAERMGVTLPDALVDRADRVL